jgi:hypothetical protein
VQWISTAKLNEKVLVKTQPISEAVKRITAKFMYLFEGPFLISKILDYSAYELKDERGKVRGEFNKRQLNSTEKKKKKYSSKTPQIHIIKY